MTTSFEDEQQVYTDLSEVHESVKDLIRRFGPSGRNLIPASELTDMLEKVSALQDRFAPEEVEVHKEPAQDGAPALGWVIMGDLSVGLTRSTHDGKLVVSLENLQEDPLEVRVEFLDSMDKVWEGVVR